MVIYTVVGFIVVWSILGGLFVAGAAAVLDFWQTLKPGQELIKVAQVDLEIRKARRRMIAESLRQARTTSVVSDGRSRWPRP